MNRGKVFTMFLVLFVLLMNVGIATPEKLYYPIAGNIGDAENAMFIALSSTPTVPQVVNFSKLVPIQQILLLSKFRQVAKCDVYIHLKSNNCGSRLVLAFDPAIKVSLFQSEDISKPFDQFT